jgi:CubicO group peptidase (beta-lactamase class C family)
MAPPTRIEGLDTARLAAIDAKLAGWIAEAVLPGAAILVARHGRLVHRAIVGRADLATGRPLAEDTIYRLFSMTKPVTGAVMMALHERGLWAFDDPIAKFLPELAEVTVADGSAPDHPPTMRELMTHSAGFGYGVGPGPHDATDKAYVAAQIWEADSLEAFVRRVASVPLAYQPGSTFRYSLSMDLQSAIIECLTGQTLPEVFRRVLFEPLGMADTDFHVPAGKLPRLASLYHMFGTDRLTVLDHPQFARDPLPVPGRPSGGAGLYGTLGDYARFAQMLLNGGALDGVRVLRPQSVAMMTANHLPQAVLDAGVTAGFQRIGPGRGYGVNGAVFHDPAAAGAPVGTGTYQWDGAAGCWFWIDPENDLLFVGMVQRMLQPGMPPLQALTQRWIAEALA